MLWINTFVLLSALAAAAAGAALGPRAQVRETVSAILAILTDKSGTLDREAKWKKIADLIYDRFDFRSMSQSILAANWQQATPEEKEKFVTYFSEYLEQIYRQKIEQYSDQSVEYLGETVDGDRAVVDTVILTSATHIPVTYKMKNNDGEWFAYDVVIEGVSMVSNYRTTYAEKVRTDGMEGLLADIRSDIETARAEYLRDLHQQLEQQEKSATN
jgi:phospholipid transport system substrate-binding protein